MVLIPIPVTDSVAATAGAILVPSYAIVFVFTWLVGVEMTPRTVWYVGWCAPVDGLCITQVTRGALQVPSVIQRFKS